MKKTIYLFKNKVILTCLLLILLAVAGSFYLLNSDQNQSRSPKPKPKNKLPEINKIIEKADFLFDHQTDSSYFYYNKAIELCEPKLDYLNKYIYSLISIANLQQNVGDYIGSEETLTKTLPYLKKLKNPKYEINYYTLTAYNYFNTYDNNMALYYHVKALKLAKKPFKRSEILNDIVIIYTSQGKYQKAVDIILPLLSKKIKHDTDARRTINNYSVLLDNLGFCYYKLGNPKALDYLNESLKIKLELKEDFELIGTYTCFASFYEKTNPKLSKMYAKKSYISACKVNSATFKANGLASLIKKTEGNELKKYSLEYIKIIDSLIINRRKAKNQFLTIKYDSKQSKTENLLLKAQKAENELELERQKNRNIISYITIVFILGFIVFLYFYLKSKVTKEKTKAIAESELRISKKLSDELTNDIYQTLTFAENIDLEKDENKEKLLNNLDLIYSRTRNISKENSPIVTDENYSIGLKEMISGFKTQEINIILNGFETISWAKIEKNKKITIYRVLHELLINMQKHSHAALVGILFKNINNEFLVTYTDNGNGVDLENLDTTNGLQNIKNRILGIKGKIDIDSSPEKGFKVFIKFPV
ncbi:tetratricopeptide repeat-containing sensor histidine kinase [[Flexibacter] sp. ATCC 35103]|uniref:tetratricopeptide repeat-containing sensor histidine kinase n=1 Tax=[Flexibacter] sp. ATCC 35103 TaxID=1937528 RepID=UPI0009F8F325|nr:tetratricopeptide repeat-containing sensor histidine kinase [[Flexibacter] sp. ATCC 35103]